MKKLLLLLVIILSTASYSQTAITDANFQQAINTCLSTNPEDGLCSDSEYGAMPDWDVSNVTDMSYAFTDRSDFNADISSWDVSSVTDMGYMFYSAYAFNQPIGNWDVSSVTNMYGMFTRADVFNQPIGDWDVSSVTDMSNMFAYSSAFNQPIGDWDVSNVTDMTGIFNEASAFNQPIGDWDVSSVTNMSGMFWVASSFNQDISNWDVSNVTNMSYLFYATPFNQDISNWCVTNIVSEPILFTNCLPLPGDYTITMVDTYGDGWQSDTGNAGTNPITIEVEDASGNITNLYAGMCSIYGPFTVDNCQPSTDGGSNAVQVITIPEGSLAANWFFGGDYWGEIEMSITGPNGDVIFSTGVGLAPGLMPIAVCSESTLIESNKPIWGTCPSLGIDGQNQLDILIYPNPVIDKLFIRGLSNPTKISVYDVLGKLVLSKTTSSEINVGNLQSGIYILKIVDNQKEIVRKFIKN